MRYFEVGDLVSYNDINSRKEGKAVVTKIGNSTYRVHWFYFKEAERVLTEGQLRNLSDVFWWSLVHNRWSKIL